VAGTVADDHVVAVGAGVGGGDDDAVLGGQHGCVVAHAPDVHALVVGGGPGDAGVPGAVVGGQTAAGGHRPDIAPGGGGPAHLQGQLVGLLHDLLLDALLLLVNGLEGLLIGRHIGLQLL